MTPPCPRCEGPHLLDHPGGLLTYQHRTRCPLLEQEDATAAADHERLHTSVLPEGAEWITGGFERDSTHAERTLLAHLDHEPAKRTRVRLLTESVRRRDWLLEADEDEEEKNNNDESN